MGKRRSAVASDFPDHLRQVKPTHLLKTYGFGFADPLDGHLLGDLRRRARRLLDLGPNALSIGLDPDRPSCPAQARHGLLSPGF
ncbi:hypothetical protein [Thermus thermophilus]|uniref:Uncharacterized protein n=2 Tax=Thermus thermophilus TaxID=274 RepID=F6DDB1_THETG|nr:hypothetical protein Ththe16_0307 [Thermus thermophilus SG0.5JP17-16]AFH39648.1 hypothetical protein TtJL18_1779 [Thermus thermophilus JL-18]NHK39422.1 hypothetical protein [Thermus thermophilus]BCZ93715.1 hypothetical protein TthAK1_03320 [Thermus thermophilus]